MKEGAESNCNYTKTSRPFASGNHHKIFCAKSDFDVAKNNKGQSITDAIAISGSRSVLSSRTSRGDGRVVIAHDGFSFLPL